ncbi:hypothetical protein [Streptomyces sp. NPDC085466]|uniref:hypothetical protein n=1 Tax=Streptomyces sp. NPDC085466 TaxID=3365725 RepID=UPI0037D33DE8
MNESRSNAKIMPVLAVLAFVAGIAFWVMRGARESAAMFACSAVIFAASWFFAVRAARGDEEQN